MRPGLSAALHGLEEKTLSQLSLACVVLASVGDEVDHPMSGASGISATGGGDRGRRRVSSMQLALQCADLLVVSFEERAGVADDLPS